MYFQQCTPYENFDHYIREEFIWTIVSIPHYWSNGITSVLGFNDIFWSMMLFPIHNFHVMLTIIRDSENRTNTLSSGKYSNIKRFATQRNEGITPWEHWEYLWGLNPRQVVYLINMFNYGAPWGKTEVNRYHYLKIRKRLHNYPIKSTVIVVIYWLRRFRVFTKDSSQSESNTTRGWLTLLAHQQGRIDTSGQRG